MLIFLSYINTIKNANIQGIVKNDWKIADLEQYCFMLNKKNITKARPMQITTRILDANILTTTIKEIKNG